MPRIINDDDDNADLFDDDGMEVSDEEAAAILGGGHPKSRPPYAPDSAYASRSATIDSPFDGSSD